MKKLSSDKLEKEKVGSPTIKSSNKLLSEVDTPKKKQKKPKQTIAAVNQSQIPSSAKSPSPSPGYAPLPPSPDMYKIKMKAQKQRVIEDTSPSKLEGPDKLLEFDIAKVWAEMDKIKSKKAENSEFFEEFQRDFYAKDKNAFKGECSPTRRLVQMKDATSKN